MQEACQVNRPFLRELAKRAGYSVSRRSSHGLRPAYDWHPKNPMLGCHFDSEEAAWCDLEVAMQAKMVEAKKLIRLADAIIRNAKT